MDQPATASPLRPAAELARDSRARFPNESNEYRRARTALLAEEIELRRHIERVAAQRRALPPGGEGPGGYVFDGPDGPVTFAGLFGDRDTLAVYNFMFGPQRERPCPMCTSLLSGWDGEIPDLEQNIAIAVIARSPIARLLAFRAERGWRHIPLFADTEGTFSRDYLAVTPDGGDAANLQIFSRRGGTIRHFWSGEMDFDSADPGQDPRGAPDLMPLWTILDCTPEGRDPDWYPSLEYEATR
jgi:predicted dithiol-disulfide oxidoreductase (DUF899 family)